MTEYLGNATYRIKKSQQLWSVKKRVLENAVAPVPGASASQSKYGWLRGTALPEPADHGCYVVEFLSDTDIRVLAYIDWYGRAFTTSQASVQPPARQENMSLVYSPDNQKAGELYVRTKNGNPLAVASLSIRGSGKTAEYTMTSPGYNFGAPCNKLHYFDMMTRAYLAFVYRPEVLGATLPLTPATVFNMLANDPLDTALKTIANYAKTAQNDPALTMSPSLWLLSRWLEDAGLNELLQRPVVASNLMLARTIYYANIFYIRIKDNDEPTPPEALIWGIEGALNRFLNLYRTFDVNSDPTLEQCLQVDRQFMTSFAGAQPNLQTTVEFPSGIPNGQWETCLRISTGIENLLAPFRLETRFRYDHDSGEALFDFRTPSAALFMGNRDADTNAEENTDSNAEVLYHEELNHAALHHEELNHEALHHAALQRAQIYAMHAGLFYAVVAFEATPNIQMTRIIARPIDENTSFSKEEPANELPNQPWIDVAFTREQYETSNAWISERNGNPILAYSTASDGDICSSVPLFNGLDPLPNFWEQSVTLEEYNAPTLPETAKAWNATSHRDMAIEFNAEHRIAGANIAQALTECTKASDAVSIILDLQTSLPDSLDGRPTSFACARLMEALTQGTIEPHDAEAVVACFQGDDPCREIYLRAQDLEKNEENAKAVKLLTEIVAAIQEEGTYTDNDTTVFRVFDSYWSRLLYNLQCGGLIDGTDEPHDDNGKTVQLAPDYLYYSLIDLVNELEGGFEESEDAIRYGKAAIALAPTVGIAYRMLGRAYMLIGEFDNAISTLHQGLRVMQMSDDIAVAYYQLGYIYWHAGDPDKGVMCYAKSIMTSPVMSDPASKELDELRSETGAQFPEASEIDGLLTQAGIPVAPLANMRDYVFNGLSSALDEGLLSAARGLVSIARRNYSQDDALTGIASSLYS